MLPAARAADPYQCRKPLPGRVRKLGLGLWNVRRPGTVSRRAGPIHAPLTQPCRLERPLAVRRAGGTGFGEWSSAYVGRPFVM